MYTSRNINSAQMPAGLTPMRAAALMIVLIFIPTAVWSRSAPQLPGQYEQTLADGSLKRRYILHIPPQYESQKDLPLVLAFHGGGGNARQLLNSCGLAAKADKEGFILVAPDGTGRFRRRFLTWNVGFGFGYAMRHRIDDIGFVRKLIEELQGNLKLDSRRIFATGISNGGILCHFLAGALSDKIAAIAPIVASLGGKKEFSGTFILPTTPLKPVSVIAFNGLLDHHIPYEGGIQQKSVGRPVYVTSAEEMHAFWVKANGCRPQPAVKLNQADQYRVITYSGGRAGSAVVQYVIFDQGHAWPGGKKPWAGADDPSTTVSADDIMWTFFKNHPKN